MFGLKYQGIAKNKAEGEVERMITWNAGDRVAYPEAKLWATAELDAQVSQLVAELLGGGAAFVPPPPAPPPKPKSKGTAKLSRETAGRKGKGVTIVSDLKLSDDDLKELCTRLKNRCGSGGTAKDNRIEIQGDHRDAIAAELEKFGYAVKRSGG